MKKKLGLLATGILILCLLFTRMVWMNLHPVPKEKSEGEKQNEELEPVKKEEQIWNAWIIQASGTEIEIFKEGQKKTLQALYQLNQSLEHVIGDITLEDGKVTKIAIKPDTVEGKVLVINEDKIEVEGYGEIPLEEHYQVYDMREEEIRQSSLGEVTVGYNTSDMVISNGMISAVLIKRDVNADRIRVLIKTTGFQNVYHDQIIITSDSDFTVFYGKKEKKYKAGKKLTIKKNSKFFADGRIEIKPETAKGKIGKLSLLSIERNNGSPSYRGTLEVSTGEKGILVINELSMEEYLYGVVPSEMPVTYGLEALKVQAVCARSYAYRQMMANGCRKYGAHVDDSVSYQVYQNFEENKEAVRAVDETCGEVLMDKEEVASAYYFSTSCGYTASAEEVWGTEEKVSYLQGKLQAINEKTKSPVLKEEEDFRSFLNNTGLKTYDSSFPWYRWTVELSAADLKKVLEKTLSVRYQANPSMVLTLKDGKYVSTPVDTVGDIKKMTITKRGESGIAMELRITGTENTVKVISEYNIRSVLAPLYTTVVRQDGSEISGLSMLPSGFFVIDCKSKSGKLKSALISGGGYGHGVGMSQNGVKAMAENGKNYHAILNYYYSGTKIGYIYQEN